MTSNRIPLIKPFINDAIKKKVCDVLDSGWLTEGPVTRKLESLTQHYIGCRHAIAVSSCTTGLELALRTLNVGPGDEVIVPNYTYPATADVVAIVGAKIILVDISRETMLIDYDKLENAITDRTKAVIPVSLFGNPLDYSRLSKIKETHGLYFIEDAACAMGAEYNGIKAGNWADISVFSFHPRKFITTGEGGMVTTNNTTWAEWIRSYKHFGLKTDASPRSKAQFQMIGTNYKLSDILAVLGVSQMELIDDLLERRRQIARNYILLLSSENRVTIPKVTDGGVHSYQSFCIFVDNRESIISHLLANGIESQIGTYALHLHPAFFESESCSIFGSHNNSTYAYDYCLTLPLYHDLSFEEQTKIVNNLISFL